MNPKQKNFLIWAVAIIAVLSFTGTMNQLFVGSMFSALDDLNGKVCTTNSDCGCYDAGGVGYAQCTDGKCNIDFCIDREPVTTWAKEKPLAWIHENPLIFFGAIAVLIGGYLMFGGKNY